MGQMSNYDIQPKKRFGQAHWMSAEHLAEYCVLGSNKIFYWWAHWAARKLLLLLKMYMIIVTLSQKHSRGTLRSHRDNEAIMSQ